MIQRILLFFLALALGASAQTTNQYQLLKFNGTTYDKAYVTGTGSDNLVFSTSPTFITPNLGIPSTLTLTHATGLVLTSGVTGVLPAANGGTGQTSATLTIGSTSISIGGTATTLAGLTSVTSTTFVGALTGTASGNLTPTAIDDTAYNATTWNGDTTHAPSKNAVRDKIESLGGGGGSSIALTSPTWIDSGGDDGTGTIGDPAHPFLTITGASAADFEIGAGTFAGTTLSGTLTIKGRGSDVTTVGDLTINGATTLQDAGFQSVGLGAIDGSGAAFSGNPGNDITGISIIASSVSTNGGSSVAPGNAGSAGAINLYDSRISGNLSSIGGDDAPGTGDGNGGGGNGIGLYNSSIEGTVNMAGGAAQGGGTHGDNGLLSAYFSSTGAISNATFVSGAFINADSIDASPVTAWMSRFGTKIYLDNQSAGNVIIGGGATASKLWLMEPSGSGTNKNTYESAAMAADIRNIAPATIGSTGDFDTITVSGTTATHSFGHDGSTLTALNAGNISSGTLAVARGGTGITSFGTGIAAALGVNTGSAGAPVLFNGAGGTPTSITLTNGTSLPVSGITASTSTALGVGSIELGHASDTSITRVSAGVAAVEGVTIDTISAANTLTNKTLTSPTLTTPVLGTPASGLLTNCTGLPINTGLTIASQAQGDILYYNGANWTRLAAGTSGYVLQTQGASANPQWAAAGGSGTKTIRTFTPENDQPPAANAALIGTRNSITYIGFNDSTEQYAIFVGVIPEAAVLTSGLAINVKWIAATATTGDVVWGAQIERSNTDLDADSFDTAVTATTTTNGTSGIIATTTITDTNIDSVTVGDVFRLKLYRKAADAADTEVGDAEVIAVEVRTAN